VLYASPKSQTSWLTRAFQRFSRLKTAWIGITHIRAGTRVKSGHRQVIRTRVVGGDARLTSTTPSTDRARVLAVPLRTQLIVVDDQSTDGTRELLQDLQRELGFTLLLQPANAGKGAALRAGFAHVTGDIVVIQDADLEYSPEEYPALIDLICTGLADVVYGSRFLGRHRVFLFTHYLGNRALTLLTNVLYNTMLTDMETCFKAMRVNVLQAMTLKSNRFGIEPELTAKIFKRGYRVYEIPITYSGRGYSEGKRSRGSTASKPSGRF
jgi:glycosyltransferase involved in cell wall biosynthesis